MRRVVTWSAIVGYGLVVSGLPLPLGVGSPDSSSAATKRLSAKDRSTPFPCMDKPCGCATAEQCFTNCCCHTPAETLVWAKAHRVEPAVITALKRRVAAELGRNEPSCCSAKKKSCCEAAAPPRVVADDVAEAPAPGKSLSLRAMLACGGIVAQWFSCGAGLPPRVVVVADPPACRGRVECVDECAIPVMGAPDVPPPRVG